MSDCSTASSFLITQKHGFFVYHPISYDIHDLIWKGSCDFFCRPLSPRPAYNGAPGEGAATILWLLLGLHVGPWFNATAAGRPTMTSNNVLWTLRSGDEDFRLVITSYEPIYLGLQMVRDQQDRFLRNHKDVCSYAGVMLAMFHLQLLKSIYLNLFNF